MSAPSRRRLRTRIIEWFVMPDPDPQPSRLDLDDHPASREIPVMSGDDRGNGGARAGGPAQAAAVPEPAAPAAAAPGRRAEDGRPLPRDLG